MLSNDESPPPPPMFAGAGKQFRGPDAPLPIDPRTGAPFATWHEWSDWRTQSEQRQRDANADSYEDWRRRTRAEIRERIAAVGWWAALQEFDSWTLHRCGFGN